MDAQIYCFSQDAHIWGDDHRCTRCGAAVNQGTTLTLTGRQSDILVLLANGHTQSTAAAYLRLSKNTIQATLNKARRANGYTDTMSMVTAYMKEKSSGDA